MKGTGEEVLPLLFGWVHGVNEGFMNGWEGGILYFFPARGEVSQVVLAALLVASVWI